MGSWALGLLGSWALWLSGSRFSEAKSKFIKCKEFIDIWLEQPSSLFFQHLGYHSWKIDLTLSKRDTLEGRSSRVV